MDYFCKECNSEAFVVDGQVVRTCSHEQSTILAPRTSVLYGEGGSEGVLSLEERIRAALLAILKIFKG